PICAMSWEFLKESRDCLPNSARRQRGIGSLASHVQVQPDFQQDGTLLCWGSLRAQQGIAMAGTDGQKEAFSVARYSTPDIRRQGASLLPVCHL
ncbi:MAG TPA: hypothetical protein DCE55_15385, partial [Planctomycetaceae bacterium]|nr:hypothetical protein [Planctomycetaceae bacterium]